MASTLNRLGFIALRTSYRIRPRSTYHPSIAPLSAFHTSCHHRDDTSKPSPQIARIPPPIIDDLDPQDRAFYEQLSPSERLEYEAELQTMHEHMTSPQTEARLTSVANQAAYEYLAESPPDDDQDDEKFEPGLMSMGEDDEEGSGADEEFEGDDMTSLAHGELDQHREMRHYARIAAWEMPLLYKLAKPYEPPSPSRPLRFRYTTYMGETHPAAKKVVLEFCTADLPLTPAQRLKLVKLVGVRYDPRRDVVKMSSEMFETQAQNKRYLGDLVDTLMDEARAESGAEGAQDAFEDVPVDFRHVKWKKTLVFPDKWKLDGAKRKALAERRREREVREEERVEKGLLVDGVAIIEEALKREPVQVASPLERALGKRGAKGKVGGKPRARR